KQYKKGTKARQFEFFTRRRLLASRIAAANKHGDIEFDYLVGQSRASELPTQGVKRIRGSFDVFALVGKEEWAKSWSDVSSMGGTETKRKTRRGKRGGEAKRQTDDPEVVAEQGSTVTSAAAPATSSAYVAPPMESAAAPFYIDTQAAADSAEAQAEKISPASYGLVNPDLQ
ncbi:hypothetical protein GGI00_006478, partial [Coemansia sp. RSA 2681]